MAFIVRKRNSIVLTQAQRRKGRSNVYRPLLALRSRAEAEDAVRALGTSSTRGDLVDLLELIRARVPFPVNNSRRELRRLFKDNLEVLPEHRMSGNNRVTITEKPSTKMAIEMSNIVRATLQIDPRKKRNARLLTGVVDELRSLADLLEYRITSTEEDGLLGRDPHDWRSAIPVYAVPEFVEKFCQRLLKKGQVESLEKVVRWMEEVFGSFDAGRKLLRRVARERDSRRTRR